MRFSGIKEANVSIGLETAPRIGVE